MALVDAIGRVVGCPPGVMDVVPPIGLEDDSQAASASADTAAITARRRRICTLGLLLTLFVDLPAQARSARSMTPYGTARWGNPWEGVNRFGPSRQETYPNGPPVVRRHVDRLRLCELEATPRIEPGMEVLQTPALPLGYVAWDRTPIL